MKTTNWKTTAELLGMAAIVASLILVAYEVRQASLQAEAAAIHVRFNQIEEANSAIALSPDLAEIYFKATRNGVETLTPIESFRLQSWERARQLRMVSQLAQYEMGFLDREAIEARLLRLPPGKEAFGRTWELIQFRGDMQS